MKTDRVNWLSVLQFGLGALSILISWIGALIFFTVGLFSIISGKGVHAAVGDPLRLFTMAAVYTAIGVLTLPSTYYALWRVLNLQAFDLRPLLNRVKPTFWITPFILVLLVGYWISSHSALAWFVFPLMHLLAVGLPVTCILIFTIRSLPLGSAQRIWGIFTSGLLLAPSMAFVFEGLVGVGFLVCFVLVISRDPNLLDQLSSLAEWMQKANPTPELLVERITPWLVHPAVILSALLMIAVVVPMLEEALKPIGLYFLTKKRISPAAGFVLGVISGGAYAMVESLMLVSAGQQWVYMMVARIGTAIIHIFTSGLIGWALVQARNKRGYARLGLSYFASVSIHGMWNALTLFSTFFYLAIRNGFTLPYDIIYRLGLSAPFGLVFLAIGTFIILLKANRLMGHFWERKIQTPVQQP